MNPGRVHLSVVICLTCQLFLAAGLLLPPKGILHASRHPQQETRHVQKPPASWRHRERRVDGARVKQICPGLKEYWAPQRLDHTTHSLNVEGATFHQRIVWCDTHWKPGGPIFFYAGNEADVYLYVNATGLIWEQAPKFGALVVFAEHRYYGETQPVGPSSWSKDPSYLTTGQALADYAHILHTIRTETEGAQDSPVIVFGGSYGGMLAAWMRLKYPHLVAGAIAASAPIGAFPAVPGFNTTAFWAIVTRDATAAAGAPDMCANNTRLAFKALLSLTNVTEGREGASRLLRLCKPMTSEQDVLDAAYWLQGAFDAYAMGNFPYPSSYINGDPAHPLPAWPMHAACQAMTKTVHMYQTDLLTALGEAAGLMYNTSGTTPCYEISAAGPAAGNAGPWDFQFCSEQMAQESPYFASNGVSDMFWDQTQGPWTQEAIVKHCRDTWGVTPDTSYAIETWGGLDMARHTSNIVFSNGLLDPWSAYGVLENVSDSVVAVIIPEGAHHLDLMFSHPADPPSVKQAREVEVTHMRRWVSEWQQAVEQRRKQRSGGSRIHGGREVAGAWSQPGQLRQQGAQEQGSRAPASFKAGRVAAAAAAAAETL